MGRFSRSGRLLRRARGECQGFPMKLLRRGGTGALHSLLASGTAKRRLLRRYETAYGRYRTAVAARCPAPGRRWAPGRM